MGQTCRAIEQIIKDGMDYVRLVELYIIKDGMDYRRLVELQNRLLRMGWIIVDWQSYRTDYK